MIQFGDVGLGHLQCLVLGQFLFVIQLRQILSQPIERFVQIFHAFSFAFVACHPSFLPNHRWHWLAVISVFHRRVARLLVSLNFFALPTTWTDDCASFDANFETELSAMAAFRLNTSNGSTENLKSNIFKTKFQRFSDPNRVNLL